MLSDTASSTSSRHTIPISPAFSTDSTTSAPVSDATSDEQPDLGAFTTVLRAWTNFQPQPRIPIGIHSASSSGTPNLDTSSSISSFTHPGLSSATVSTTDEPGTVWEQRPIWQSYLNLHNLSSVDDDDDDDGHSPASDTSRTVEIASDTDNQDVASVQDSLNHESTDATEMAVPVFSPTQEPTGFESMLSSSQHTLRRPDFPIHEPSTIGSRHPSQWSQTSSPDGVSHTTFSDYSSRRYRPRPYQASEDPEAVVQSLLKEAARTRALVNDASSVSESPHDRSSRPTPESIHTSSRPPSLQTQPNLETPVSSVGEIVLARSPPMFATQIEPASPLPTPTEGSETFPYEEVEVGYDVRTPTRPVGGNSYGSVAHSYPHPLIGLHVLPTTLSRQQPTVDSTGYNHPHHPQSGSVDDNDDDSIKYHPGSETSYGHTLSVSENFVGQEDDETKTDAEHPTLGLLDEALGFIAAERARFEATKKAGTQQQQHNPEWALTVVEPKRKRRRRKHGSATVPGNEKDGGDQSSSSAAAVVHTPTRPLLLAVAPKGAADEFQGEDEEGLGASLETPKKKKYKLPTLTTTIVSTPTPTMKTITILTRPKAVPTAAISDISVTSNAGAVEGDASFSLMGKRGKRVGRREREREKAKRDAERAVAGVDNEASTADVEDQEDNDEEDANEDDNEDHSNTGGTRTSTTQQTNPKVDEPLLADVKDGNVSDQAAGTTKRTKKTRSKRVKSLVHTKSYPNIQAEAELEHMNGLNFGEDEDVLDQNKRSRLIALSNKLLLFFPEQRKDLKRVIARLESSAAKNVDKGKKARGHVKNGGKGGSASITLHSMESFSNPDIALDDEPQDPAEFDIQGPAPTPGASLIHVFIDHSNILIGLINYVKRNPPPQSIVDEYLGLHSAGREVDSGEASPSSNPIPTRGKGKKALPDSPIAESPTSGSDYPIPLPSFATASIRSQQTTSLSKSLPSESAIDAIMGRRAKIKSAEGALSDGYDDEEGKDALSARKEKKFPRHLWHAALALILERGRPVSRRVVVTSSPLYQPMTKIENLGYEVRIYLRVPDLGDGMDRREKEGKYGSGKSNTSGKAGTPSSPVKASSTYGAASSSFSSPVSRKSHGRHLSGNTTGTDSGSGSNNHKPLASNVNPATSSANIATPGKVRFREQGVDELLQLKLHQALADADKVPKGSTIVLATGDGNVGQFNEDGFLGPVRTALKRGWKVELYAWEDGLSKSWRREFGENSEWGQKGLFRVIALEQFATSLVEAAGW